MKNPHVTTLQYEDNVKLSKEYLGNWKKVGIFFKIRLQVVIRHDDLFLRKFILKLYWIY